MSRITAPTARPSGPGWLHALLCLSGLVAAPTTVAAQLERLTPPRGVLRVDIGGEFQNLSSRINQGSTEDLLVDIAARRGALNADGDINTGTFRLGAALGLTDRIAVYGDVPIVRQRVRAEFLFAADPGPGVDTARINTSFTLAGDAAVGAAFVLWNRWDPEGQLGGSRAAVAAEVRFPTGYPSDPEDIVPLGTGGERTEVAGILRADLGRGRWGVRLDGDYRWRIGRNVERFLPTGGGAGQTAVLSYDPGSVLHLGATPFFRLEPAFALHAGLGYTVTGADGYDYAGPGETVPGVDPNLLAAGSEGNYWTIGVGVTYSSPSTADPRGPGLPVEARWIYQGVFASSSGIVPKARRVALELRMYFGIF